MAALQEAGHGVSLLAPARAGAALLGRGGGETSELIDWEGPEVAALLGGEGSGPLARRLRALDVILAYSRSASLLSELRRLGREVVVHDPQPRTGHASRWLAQPVMAWGADPDPLPPPHRATPEEEAAAAAYLRLLPPGFLALHPGSGSPGKNWPAESFLAIATALSPRRAWLLVQGPADAALSTPPEAVVARELPLRVLGALLARAGLYVGNDSGVSHLAAAWGAPTLALFGPSDPEVWSPLGPRVKTLRAAGGSMTDLKVEQVRAEAERAFRSAGPRRPSG